MAVVLAEAATLTSVFLELSYRYPKAAGMDAVEASLVDGYRVRCWRYRQGRARIGADVMTIQDLRYAQGSRSDFYDLVVRCLDNAYRQIVGPEDFWPFRIGRRGPKYLRAAP
jgi:hypothetical protein